MNRYLFSSEGNNQKLFAAANDPKEIWIIPGAKYALTLLEVSTGERAGDFFDKNLNKAGRLTLLTRGE